MLRSLVGSERCIRDGACTTYVLQPVSFLSRRRRRWRLRLQAAQAASRASHVVDDAEGNLTRLRGDKYPRLLYTSDAADE